MIWVIRGLGAIFIRRNVIIKQGNLFNTNCKVIGHGVNIVGVMGAGIAKTFKDRFPLNYSNYAIQCKNHDLEPGGIYIYPAREFTIVNIATQDRPGPNATYMWVFQGLYRTALQLSDEGHSTIAIPKIGCGIGGLQWRKVAKIIHLVEELVEGFEFEVWDYDQVT